MQVRVEIRDGLTAIDRDVWDGLVRDGSPFLEWGWLASLEEAGCVGAETGWLPQHLTLWQDDRLIGACPLYLKAHSHGEFVFDHGWADAAERGGIPYYPKMLVAIPFTPATGARFLVHPAVDRTAVVRMLGDTLKRVCTDNAFSSVHVNFCLPDEAHALGELGYVRRTGYQFQWINPGWQTFDDYLGAFRSKRRVQIKRERRELELQGIVIRTYTGDEIPDELVGAMFGFYKSTIDKLYWGRQYLTRKLFDLLHRRWNRRLCFLVAYRDGQPVAGTFNVRKGDTLYGRYWGTREELRFLHFNVCYYATIEYCLGEGIQRFEPGAGGEFKYLRGFDARPTQSMHFLADQRLAHAVRRYLDQEREAVAHEITWLDEQSPLKR